MWWVRCTHILSSKCSHSRWQIRGREHEKIVNYDELLMRKSEREFFAFMRVTKKKFSELADRL